MESMSLKQFSVDPSSVPIEEIPATLSMLAALQGALAARLLNAASATGSELATETSDRMLTVKECAERLRRSTKWVYRRNKTLPFARCLGPRSWVFSQKGLEKWLSSRRT
jgi:predicted DNA-binding transcriptional regulator AlpA